MIEPHRRSPLTNFGRNVVFQPKEVAVPSDEQAVLQLLRRHRGAQFRAHGRLHSWSRVAATDAIAVDLRQLNTIVLNLSSGEPTATVGAGCQLKVVLERLNADGWTLPALGLITEQTVTGATSTATHGSGRHCLSHYIQRLRIATYGPDGEPILRVIDAPDELNAARCALGQLGIITALEFPIRRQYQVEEFFEQYTALEDVLAAEEVFPLQQFYFVPWKWNYFGQHRREVSALRSWNAASYRWFWSLGMDRGFHWLILGLARWLPTAATPVFFRHILPLLIPRRWKVVDRSDRQLTMQHQLYRHIEVELFVRRSQLPAFLGRLQTVLEWSHRGGTEEIVDPGFLGVISAAGLDEDWHALAGQYCHHYPICIRKVLPDQGWISMSGSLARGSDAPEPWYSVSLIAYSRPTARDGFFRFAEVLVQLAIAEFQARSHWGKYRPPTTAEAERLYPRWNEFLAFRLKMDPLGAFRDAESPSATKAARLRERDPANSLDGEPED